MPDAWVVNASPLIFLGNAGRLELLRLVGPSRIVVPRAVYDEVAGPSHSDAASRALAAADWIERADPVPIPTSVVEWDLGAGESAVVAHAVHFGGTRAVLDDLSGRRCALAHGLEVTGTIGVIVAAHRRGHISDLRRSLEDLRANGMWLSDSVIEHAVRLAHRHG